MLKLTFIKDISKRLTEKNHSFVFPTQKIESFLYYLKNDPNYASALDNAKKFTEYLSKAFSNAGIDIEQIIKEKKHEALLNSVIPDQKINSEFQKIVYLLDNNKLLLQQVKQSLQDENILDNIKHFLKNISSAAPNQTEYARKLILEIKIIITSLHGKSIDEIISEIRRNRNHEVKDSSFLSLDLDQARKNYPSAELERRMLLHEDIQDKNTSRFFILDTVATILRKYREDIKAILGSDARIKFRGSLVRGLKGYPKDGVAPTLDSYDCDAFLEVSDEWWSELKKLHPAAEHEEDDKVRKKPVRSYEPLNALLIGVPAKNPKPISLTQAINEQEMRSKLEKLLEIEEKIKADIKAAKQKGTLAGYSSYENGDIDFDFYIRPASSVRKTYLEGNPYTPEMIERRGYPEFAKAHLEQSIPEFLPSTDGTFKREVLPTTLKTKGNGFEPKGIMVEEYQAVIGRREWYIEDKNLFDWRHGVMRPAKLNRGKFQASRSDLHIYDEPLAPIKRDYLDPIYKIAPSHKGLEQKTVNKMFDRAYGRQLMGKPKTYAEAHPLVSLGEAKVFIGCYYSKVRLFDLALISEMPPDDLALLRKFFSTENEETMTVTSLVKNIDNPFYIETLIDILREKQKVELLAGKQFMSERLPSPKQSATTDQQEHSTQPVNDTVGMTGEGAQQFTNLQNIPTNNSR